jgi:hypothetical protein
MDEQPESAYCAKCQEIHPVLLLPDDPGAARRCQVCGFPVGSDLRMADPKLNSQAFKAGANLALRKPAQPATVLRTIQAALALTATKKV